MNISLTSSDSLSGVKWLNYSIGGIWHQYTGAFSLSEGTYTLKFNATDLAGNREQTKTLVIKIDKTAPETQSTEDGTKNSDGWYRTSVNIMLNAADSASGINATYYRIDGGVWQTYEGSPFPISDDGIHTIEFYSIDNAGNAETTNSMPIKIDTEKPCIINDNSDLKISLEKNKGQLVIFFDKSMNISSFHQKGNVNISGGKNVQIANMSWSKDDTTLTIYLSDIEYDKTYNIAISNVSDIHGNTASFNVRAQSQPRPAEKFDMNIILIILLVLILSILIFIGIKSMNNSGTDNSKEYLEKYFVSVAEGLSALESKSKEIYEAVKKPSPPIPPIPKTVYTDIPEGKISGKIEIAGKDYRIYIPEKEPIEINKNTFKRFLSGDKLKQILGIHLKVTPASDGRLILVNRNEIDTPVFVNEKEVRRGTEIYIKDGDVIQVGNILSLRFSIVGGNKNE